MKILPKTLLCCLSTAWCCIAAAQFNDTINHHINFATTGSINKTNAGKSYLLSNGLGFNIKNHKTTVNTSAGWVYGQQDKTLTNNDFLATTDIDFLKQVHRLYFWGLFNFESSYSLKTKYRFQPGVGIGFRLLDTSDARLLLSDGILFETTKLTDAAFGKDQYETFRNSLRIKYHFVINKVIVLDGVNFWQPSLSSFRDYILKFNNSLSVQLRQWLSLVAAMSYNKTSRSGSENLLLTFGITLDKYF